MNKLRLGNVPINEDKLDVAMPNYRLMVLQSCNKYMDLLRNTFGKEPDGSKLDIEAFDCDSGVCFEVSYRYDESNNDAIEYARKCQEEAPKTWY